MGRNIITVTHVVKRNFESQVEVMAGPWFGESPARVFICAPVRLAFRNIVSGACVHSGAGEAFGPEPVYFSFLYSPIRTWHETGSGEITPEKCRPAFTNAFLSSCRITLGPYRKCPGVKRRSGAP